MRVDELYCNCLAESGTISRSFLSIVVIIIIIIISCRDGVDEDLYLFCFGTTVLVNSFFFFFLLRSKICGGVIENEWT